MAGLDSAGGFTQWLHERKSKGLSYTTECAKDEESVCDQIV